MISSTYRQLYDIIQDFKAISVEHPALGFLINSKVKRFYRKNSKNILALENMQRSLSAKHFVIDVDGNPKMYKDFQGNPKGFVHKNMNDRSGYDKELIKFLKTPVNIYE